MFSNPRIAGFSCADRSLQDAAVRTCPLQLLLQSSHSVCQALKCQSTLKLLENSVDSSAFLGLTPGLFFGFFFFGFWTKKKMRETALYCIIIIIIFKHRASFSLEKTSIQTKVTQRMKMLHPRRFAQQPQLPQQPSFYKYLEA